MTFKELLDARAADCGDKVFVTYDDRAVTFAETRHRVNAVANSLLAMGVGPGDAVAMFTGNCPEWVEVWLAAAEIGAISVPVNAAFSGDFLLHQLRDAGVKLILVDPELVPRLDEVRAQLPDLHTVVVRGDAALYAGDAERVNGGRPIPATELSCIFYTSGTTGPSKGAVLTQQYLVTSARTFIDAYAFTRDDVIYGAVPLFHFSGSLGVVLPALVAGLSSALDSFSVHQTWTRVRQLGATVFVGVGPMLVMLYSLPPDPAEAGLPMRLLVAAPVPPELHRPIEERYGATIVGGYGMTEVFPVALHRVGEEIVPGSAGRPNPNFDVALLDEDDEPVAAGAVGEIACRPRLPHAMFEGYHERPADTLAQFRNLWFHTGDLGRFDEAGNLFFVDRAKDAIRRRGENISSFEVERSVLAHAAVAECAAHAVPSAVGEDDVKICVVLKPGAELSAPELLEHCVATLPRFAVPRYIEFVAELPKNAVGRVQKAKLRTAALGPGTWDRDKA